MEEKIAPAEKAVATIESIVRLGDKRTVFGDIAVSPANWKKVLELAKEGLNSRDIIKDLKKKISEKTKEIAGYVKKILGLEKSLEEYEGSKSLSEKIKYNKAVLRAPRRLAEAVAEILREPPENEQHRQIPHRQKDRGYGL